MLPQTMPPIGGGAARKRPFLTPMNQGPMPPTPGGPTLSARPGTPPGIGGPAPAPQSMGQPMSATAASPMAMGGGMMAPAGGMPASRGRYGSDNPGPNTPPAPGGNTNPAWNPQGGISPFNASSGATGIGDFQRFSDAAYQRQVDRLNPQFDSQQRSFEQDMVNKGIAPGTPAYDTARANFDNSRNDAMEGARTQADQLGAALQNQSFNQGATNSQGLRELLLGQMGADASRYGANASASASRYGADRNAESNANQLAYQMQQGDFGNMMQLLNFGQGTQGFNNGVIGQNNGSNSQWMGQNAALLGLYQGGSNPSNIDVTGPYNNQYNGQLNQAQMNQQQNNANNQNYAQWAAALYCDRDAKIEIAQADPQAALDAIAGLPYATWTYKADPEQTPHVGTYAQDFNKALGLPESTQISIVDLLGSLIGSVQALAKQNEELQSQLLSVVQSNMRAATLIDKMAGRNLEASLKELEAESSELEKLREFANQAWKVRRDFDDYGHAVKTEAA